MLINHCIHLYVLQDVHVHHLQVMDTPLDVQEMVAIVYHIDVTVDTVLLVTVGEHVVLMVPGQEVIQFVRKVHMVYMSN